jgi:hypothetical protein
VRHSPLSGRLRRRFSAVYSADIQAIRSILHGSDRRRRIHSEHSDQLWIQSLRSEFTGQPITPFSPPSGPATGSFNGLHRESNFLAILAALSFIYPAAAEDKPTKTAANPIAALQKHLSSSVMSGTIWQSDNALSTNKSEDIRVRGMLDSKNGVLLWGSASTEEDSTRTHFIALLDRSDGKRVWRTDISQAKGPTINEELIVSAQVLDDGQIFVVSIEFNGNKGNIKLSSVDRESGKLKTLSSIKSDNVSYAFNPICGTHGQLPSPVGLRLNNGELYLYELRGLCRIDEKSGAISLMAKTGEIGFSKCWSFSGTHAYCIAEAPDSTRLISIDLKSGKQTNEKMDKLKVIEVTADNQLVTLSSTGENCALSLYQGQNRTTALWKKNANFKISDGDAPPELSIGEKEVVVTGFVAADNRLETVGFNISTGAQSFVLPKDFSSFTAVSVCDLPGVGMVSFQRNKTTREFLFSTIDGNLPVSAFGELGAKQGNLQRFTRGSKGGAIFQVDPKLPGINHRIVAVLPPLSKFASIK